METLIIFIFIISSILFTWIAILSTVKKSELPPTLKTHENRLKQIEQQLWHNPTPTKSDRRLAQIERKLDLILYHLDIDIPELEDSALLSVSPEFCNVILQFVPPESKIATLKTVRTLTGLGLKEAKNLIESAPQIVLHQLPAAEAESAKLQLEQSGARVTLQ
ncbi:ribosomal protein L7/L12 [Laspinema sp. A4]|uniref:bL12 family ribosomal protein n=1 Tax=Laspinema sp. D2d TaxID=2953686 RepID=UPI0021BB37ED|nr:bL12 family ribosomal protein [Laspinema sp. D2d]MCT7985257.1 ribosomal protein L7/L12 [Laspinema sp. D2d]